MVDRHYSCVLVGGVASESRVLLARGTMAVLANWGNQDCLGVIHFQFLQKLWQDAEGRKGV